MVKIILNAGSGRPTDVLAANILMQQARRMKNTDMLNCVASIASDTNQRKVVLEVDNFGNVTTFPIPAGMYTKNLITAGDQIAPYVTSMNELTATVVRAVIEELTQTQGYPVKHVDNSIVNNIVNLYNKQNRNTVIPVEYQGQPQGNPQYKKGKTVRYFGGGFA